MDVGRTVAARVSSGEVHGAAWLVDRGGHVTSGIAGDAAPGSVFRISSVTKPVVGALAMALVDDGVLGLDDDVDEWLPELADRRVLRTPASPLDDTVPAERPITVRDVLEFRTGLGIDFAGEYPGPVLGALAERGLAVGPPAPQQSPPPDEWMRIVGGVPLSAQPGSRWLYNTSAQVLGVLLARAAGQPLPELLAARLLEPLGMLDTGFSAPADRLGTHWLGAVYDEADGQWARPPAFPDAAAGLVSTVADLHAFATMLRGRGATVLSPESVTAMTSAHVGAHDPDGHEGWGLGLGVFLSDAPDGRHAGTYGWDGGLGSTWWTDPVTDTIAILLTTDAWTAPQPTPVFTDFWREAFAS
jgi:CubicO group peptidase (beta-lactamase class C family)